MLLDFQTTGYRKEHIYIYIYNENESVNSDNRITIIDMKEWRVIILVSSKRINSQEMMPFLIKN